MHRSPLLLFQPLASSRAPRRSRGFTLLELMVVVIIITILSVIALPGISKQLDQREARKSAEQIAGLYRGARLRAMGRGSAMMVQFNAGAYQVREAVWGTGTAPVGCEQLPVTSCTNTNWTNGVAGNQLLESFDATGNNQFEVKTALPGGTDAPFFELCFTPLGRAYSRTSAAQPFLPLVGVPRATVKRTQGEGLTRQVVIPPNGATKVNAL